MLEYKADEIQEFRKNKFYQHYLYARKLVAYGVDRKFTAKRTQKKDTKITVPIKVCKKFRTNHINSKYPPLELVSEMLEKGQQRICEKGYIYVEYKDYKCYLHRLVVLHNGYKIPKGYGVHHKDRNKLNNNIDNLEVLSWQEHRKIHCTKVKNIK